jgi:hypothetical protein
MPNQETRPSAEAVSALETYARLSRFAALSRRSPAMTPDDRIKRSIEEAFQRFPSARVTQPESTAAE